MSATSVRAAFEARQGAVNALHTHLEEVNKRDENDPSEEDLAVEQRMNDDINKLDVTIKGGMADLEREENALEARDRFAALDLVRNDREPDHGEIEKRHMKDVLRDVAEGRTNVVKFEFRDDVALVTGTATDGAELIQTDLSRDLVDFLSEGTNSMINLARIVQTTSGNPITIPTVASHSTILLEGETDTIARSAPQFGTATLNAYKYAVLVQVSSELLTDSAFPFVPFVMEQAAFEIGQLTGTAFITGSGSSQPQGIDLATTLSQTSAATGAWTADELIDVYHTLTTPYRGNATWLLADGTVQAFRKLKDSEGQYLWQSGMAAGLPDMLFGRPVVTDNAVMTMATGNESVIFGDVARAYTIRIVNGLDVARSDEFAFDTDLVTFRFVSRVDGVITDENAVVVGHNA